MMLCRIPVRIEATTIAAITPMTIPSTVRKLRNLFERTLSSAMTSVSRGKNLGSLSFINIVTATESQRHREREIKTGTEQRSLASSLRVSVPLGLSRFRQRDNRIQSRCFECRVDSRDHANDARDDQRQQNVTNRARHRDFSQFRNQGCYAPGCQQSDHSPKCAQPTRLDQKLHQNLFLCGAHSFAQSNFKSQLGHADEHDVHDNDSANDQSDECDRHDYRRDRSGKLIDLLV